MSGKTVAVVGVGRRRASDMLKNTPIEKINADITDPQAEKLAKFLNCSPDTIKYYYNDSEILRGFYISVLKKKNWAKE